MKYFYIFGNICSIFGFIIAIIAFPENPKISDTAKLAILASILITIFFWIYFYLKPLNRLAAFIEARTDFSGKYQDSKNQIQDIIEGDFDVDCQNWGALVTLPPFESPPLISILYSHKGKGDVPKIVDITNDNFTVRINSSTQEGTWRWRARGKLLQVIKIK